jgi:hypothetical protein
MKKRANPAKTFLGKMALSGGVLLALCLLLPQLNVIAEDSTSASVKSVLSINSGDPTIFLAVPKDQSLDFTVTPGKECKGEKKSSFTYGADDVNCAMSFVWYEGGQYSLLNKDERSATADFLQREAYVEVSFSGSEATLSTFERGKPATASKSLPCHFKYPPYKADGQFRVNFTLHEADQGCSV